MRITVATCQFPVSADVRANYEHIARQVCLAKQRGADVVHFPECALSGYADTDVKSYDGLDWDLLHRCARQTLQLAEQMRIWIILGTAHRLTGRHKPHNSLYIINDEGQIVDRYDKRFCAGDSDRTGELAHYTPGDHSCSFAIKGVRCGALICHEYRYPELYRAYKRDGVQLVFHSFHAGGNTAENYKEIKKQVGERFARFSDGSTLPEITIPATMKSYAANNALWISCPNSSRNESCWGAFAVRPDGVVVGRLRRNVAGVLVTVIDPEEQFYDSTAAWRDRAMSGVFHSGRLVKDVRLDNRKSL
jgi:deaminated glutathione amidase